MSKGGKTKEHLAETIKKEKKKNLDFTNLTQETVINRAQQCSVIHITDYR